MFDQAEKGGKTPKQSERRPIRGAGAGAAGWVRMMLPTAQMGGMLCPVVNGWWGASVLPDPAS